MTHHLAELNVATLLHDLEHPAIDEFRNNLDRINTLAESMEGFVWRLKDDTGNATEFSAFPNPLIIANMSVWKDVDSLKKFSYETAHVEFLRKRKLWFERPTEVHMVLWWVPIGHEPTLEEAVERLTLLRENGATEKAFSFQKVFEI